MTEEEIEREPRRPKGWLMDDIERVLRDWESGIGPDPQRKQVMTPHRACDLLVTVEGLDRLARPSSGAVNNVFKRWERCRYATFTDKPYAFAGFTQEGADLGFQAMWSKYATGEGPSLEELRKQLAVAQAVAEADEVLLAAFDVE